MTRSGRDTGRRTATAAEETMLGAGEEQLVEDEELDETEPVGGAEDDLDEQ